MKIVIPGGSGQVGRMLCRALAEQHEPVVLTRSGRCGQDQRCRCVPWDGRAPGPWMREIDGADVVINLAGRSVNCRYHPANRKAMLESRVDSTQAVGRAIAQAARPPRVWLQASTATIYAHRFDAPNDERSGILGGSEPDAPEKWRFSIDVAKAWESAATGFPLPHTRLVLLRSALTLSPDPGGIFDVLIKLVRRGLGGRNGSGRQFVSWIHELDFVAAVRWLIERDDLSGIVNLAAPNPLPNDQFMRELRRACRETIGGIGPRLALPATRWMLEIGAIVMRTETELILKSRRVIPTRLLESGFSFAFPAWPEAARELCARWQRLRASRG